MEHRLAIVMVHRYQPTDDLFNREVAIALRQYADAIDRGEMGSAGAESFYASNGARVSVVAGTDRGGNDAH